MHAPTRLITQGTLAATIALLLLSFTACQQPKPKPKPEEPPRVVYNESYDAEIKEIIELARKDRWEEARTNAFRLYQKDPKNPILARVETWVEQQSQQR